MDQYYEQSVAKQTGKKTGMLMGLCWLGVAVLLIAAIVLVVNILPDGSGAGINWLNLPLAIVFLVSAGGLFVRKDYLRMEYDYILYNDNLEISGVMNSKRRKRLASIDLKQVQRAGIAQNGNCPEVAGDKTVRIHKWYGQTGRIYIIYREENVRHAALLELDDRLLEMIRRQLPVGVWRNAEGETTNYASLS